MERRTGKSAQPKASAVTDEKIFATPRKVEDVADCYFYHTMELPGRGVIEGRDWDLRGRVDEYLGNVDFAGQRVLEIGPASGFLTFEMEKRGADVISVEVTDEHGWDFVPYPDARLEEVFGPRRIVMQQLKNSYWFNHAALQSKAKVYYGDAYNLPAALGEFDIAVMGAVLLHCRDPLRIVEQCAKKSEITHYRRQVPSGLGRRARYLALRRRRRISSGTPGGISARNSSLSFSPSWDSPARKLRRMNNITEEKRTRFLRSSDGDHC